MRRDAREAGLRRVVLSALFNLLYHRFGFLHEAAGNVAFGAAWSVRRRLVAPDVIEGIVLDIGCGEGRLLASRDLHDEVGIGVEPSSTMARRARRRDVAVVQAQAQRLPLPDASVAHVVATYPGPWLFDSATWSEIGRVTAPGASVMVLLGGTVTSGRGATARRLLGRLLYGGAGNVRVSDLPRLGSEIIPGNYDVVTDQWGEAVVWRGTRVAR